MYNGFDRQIIDTLKFSWLHCSNTHLVHWLAYTEMLELGKAGKRHCIFSKFFFLKYTTNHVHHCTQKDTLSRFISLFFFWTATFLPYVTLVVRRPTWYCVMSEQNCLFAAVRAVVGLSHCRWSAVFSASSARIVVSGALRMGFSYLCRRQTVCRIDFMNCQTSGWGRVRSTALSQICSCGPLFRA